MPTKCIALVGFDEVGSSWAPTREGLQALHKAGSGSARFITIIGAQGSGKSFLAAQLAQQGVTGELSVPVSPGLYLLPQKIAPSQEVPSSTNSEEVEVRSSEMGALPSCKLACGTHLALIDQG